MSTVQWVTTREPPVAISKLHGILQILFYSILDQKKMSIALEHFWRTVLLEIPLAVDLSVCTGVTSCVWTIPLRVVQMCYISWLLSKRAQNSASVSDTIIIFTMFETVWTAQLLSVVFLKFLDPIKKKGLLICCMPSAMIIMIHSCGFRGSCHWHHRW